MTWWFVGKLGDIIVSIEENIFQVTGMKMFYLSVEQAEEYLEIYKGVLPEYKVRWGVCIWIIIC